MDTIVKCCTCKYGTLKIISAVTAAFVMVNILSIMGIFLIDTAISSTVYALYLMMILGATGLGVWGSLKEKYKFIIAAMVLVVLSLVISIIIMIQNKRNNLNEGSDSEEADVVPSLVVPELAFLFFGFRFMREVKKRASPSQPTSVRNEPTTNTNEPSKAETNSEQSSQSQSKDSTPPRELKIVEQ